jgi:hypothetical protein
MTSVGVLKCVGLAAAAILTLSFGESAIAATCGRACLLQQAAQFNSNMLAHTTGRIPLADSAKIRENTKAIALDCAGFAGCMRPVCA